MNEFPFADKKAGSRFSIIPSIVIHNDPKGLVGHVLVFGDGRYPLNLRCASHNVSPSHN